MTPRGWRSGALGQRWQLATDIRLRRPIGSRTPPWIPVLARLRRGESATEANFYEAVIDQFDVGSNRRYRKNSLGGGETYCNIFVWDVTRAMGAEIPHWIEENGSPAACARGRETTANMVVDWLLAHGEQYRWRQIPMAEAQTEASAGRPVVAVWPNNGGPGHIAVVRPGSIDADGPWVAHAGNTNSAKVRAAEAFAKGWQRGEIVYFVNR